jgi:hypothetical protein
MGIWPPVLISPPPILFYFNVSNALMMGTTYSTGGTNMNENELKAIIEKSVERFDHLRMVEKIQYIMDFGKVYIQYDFCLN